MGESNGRRGESDMADIRMADIRREADRARLLPRRRLNGGVYGEMINGAGGENTPVVSLSLSQSSGIRPDRAVKQGDVPAVRIPAVDRAATAAITVRRSMARFRAASIHTEHVFYGSSDGPIRISIFHILFSFLMVIR